MINEIISVYSKQLELYNTLKETLERVQKSDFDLITYNLEFENADFILDKIKQLNEKAEQLKLLYVSKHRLNDFTGEEIKRVETSEDYYRLKNTVDNVTNMISIVKRIQDSAINRLQAESNVNKRVQTENEKKNIVSMYKNNIKKDNHPEHAE